MSRMLGLMSPVLSDPLSLPYQNAVFIDLRCAESNKRNHASPLLLDLVFETPPNNLKF